MGESRHSYNGMNRDLSKVKFPKEYYFEGRNIRITATESQSSMDVINEVGNELILTLPTIYITPIDVIPSTLTLTSVSGTYVKLNWSREYNEDLIYRIERNTDGNSWEVITITTSPILEYIDSTTTEFENYDYRVVTLRGGLEAVSNVAGIYTSNEIVSTPINLSVTVSDEGLITLMWDDYNLNVNSYNIFYDNITKYPNGDPANPYVTIPAEQTSSGQYIFRDTSLQDGTRFNIGDTIEYSVQSITQLNNLSSISNVVAASLAIPINIDPVGDSFEVSVGELGNVDGVLVEWTDDFSTHSFYRDTNGIPKILYYKLLRQDLSIEDEDGNYPDFEQIGDEFYLSSTTSDVTFQHLDSNISPEASYLYKLDIYVDANPVENASLLMSYEAIEITVTKPSVVFNISGEGVYNNPNQGINLSWEYFDDDIATLTIERRGVTSYIDDEPQGIYSDVITGVDEDTFNYSDLDLTLGEEYQYRFTRYNSLFSSLSTESQVIVAGSVMPVTDVIASDVPGGGITISWVNSSNGVIYLIERSNTSNGPKTLLNVDDSTTLPIGYEDTTAVVGENYYYYVTAKSNSVLSTVVQSNIISST